MKSTQLVLRTLAAALLLGSAMQPLHAAEGGTRTELRREPLAGAPGMEVIVSLSELKPGDELPAHFHNGIETGYVLEGGMLQAPGKEAYAVTTGSTIMNLRDVLHGGVKVVGTKTIKLFLVHIVDKGKPLYDSKPKPAGQ